MGENGNFQEFYGQLGSADALAALPLLFAPGSQPACMNPPGIFDKNTKV